MHALPLIALFALCSASQHLGITLDLESLRGTKPNHQPVTPNQAATLPGTPNQPPVTGNQPVTTNSSTTEQQPVTPPLPTVYRALKNYRQLVVDRCSEINFIIDSTCSPGDRLIWNRKSNQSIASVHFYRLEAGCRPASISIKGISHEIREVLKLVFTSGTTCSSRSYLLKITQLGKWLPVNLSEYLDVLRAMGIIKHPVGAPITNDINLSQSVVDITSDINLSQSVVDITSDVPLDQRHTADIPIEIDLKELRRGLIEVVGIEFWKKEQRDYDWYRLDNEGVVVEAVIDSEFANLGHAVDYGREIGNGSVNQGLPREGQKLPNQDFAGQDFASQVLWKRGKETLSVVVYRTLKAGGKALKAQVGEKGEMAIRDVLALGFRPNEVSSKFFVRQVNDALWRPIRYNEYAKLVAEISQNQAIPAGSLGAISSDSDKLGQAIPAGTLGAISKAEGSSGQRKALPDELPARFTRIDASDVPRKLTDAKLSNLDLPDNPKLSESKVRAKAEFSNPESTADSLRINSVPEAASGKVVKEDKPPVPPNPPRPTKEVEPVESAAVSTVFSQAILAGFSGAILGASLAAISGVGYWLYKVGCQRA